MTSQERADAVLRDSEVVADNGTTTIEPEYLLAEVERHIDDAVSERVSTILATVDPVKLRRSANHVLESCYGISVTMARGVLTLLDALEGKPT